SPASPITTDSRSVGSWSAARSAHSDSTVLHNRNELASATSPGVGCQTCHSPIPATSPPACEAIATPAAPAVCANPSLIPSPFQIPQVCAELYSCASPGATPWRDAASDSPSAPPTLSV